MEGLGGSGQHQDTLAAGGNGKTAPIRALAVEHIKITHSVLHLAHIVAVAHGQLVEIAEHGQIQFAVGIHRKHLVCM